MYAKLMSGVATVSKTKELKTCYGADQVKNQPSQFWKESSHASGSSFLSDDGLMRGFATPADFLLQG
jgi:hypothetical protein